MYSYSGSSYEYLLPLIFLGAGGTIAFESIRRIQDESSSFVTHKISYWQGSLAPEAAVDLRFSRTVLGQIAYCSSGFAGVFRLDTPKGQSEVVTAACKVKYL